MYQVKEKTLKITPIFGSKLANHATITQHNSPKSAKNKAVLSASLLFGSDALNTAIIKISIN